MSSCMNIKIAGSFTDFLMEWLYKVDKPYWSTLKSFLVYLDYLYPHELNDINEDKKISERLKEL